jgi:hypothetical protein
VKAAVTGFTSGRGTASGGCLIASVFPPAVAVLVALASLGACNAVEDVLDPVHARAVAALGPETFGLEQGPTHRPGQPCLTCHGGQGPGSPELSVGGTVYETQAAMQWLEGAIVTLTDAKGMIKELTTNRTGNCLVRANEWRPVYPMRVSVSFGGVSIDMVTHVGRAGSCADCHTDPAGPASAGHVYLVATPADFPGSP